VSTATGTVKRIAVMGRGFVTPSQDGKALLIGPIDESGRRAVVIRHDLATGQETELISQQGAILLIVSPDGARVAAAMMAADGRLTVNVKPMEGGDWKAIATFPARTQGSMEWTDDGAYLRILRVGAGAPNPVVFRAPADGGNLEKLGDLPANAVGGTWAFRVHPDGRRGLFTSNVVRTELWSLENFLPKPQARK
jgi:hypothetical protein